MQYSTQVQFPLEKFYFLQHFLFSPEILSGEPIYRLCNRHDFITLEAYFNVTTETLRRYLDWNSRLLGSCLDEKINEKMRSLATESVADRCNWLGCFLIQQNAAAVKKISFQYQDGEMVVQQSVTADLMDRYKEASLKS